MSGYAVIHVCRDFLRRNRAPVLPLSATAAACMRECLLLASIGLLPLVGCQSPRVPLLDPAAPEACPFSQIQSQVTAAVWPWTDRGQVSDQFGVDLLSKRILPVQIVIANRGDQTIRFSSTQVALAYDDGPAVPILSAGEMTQRTLKDTGTAPFLIYVGTLGLGASISGAVMLSLENENLDIRQVRRDTYLSTITLDAQETMSGFLFFDIPLGVDWRSRSLSSTLTIRRIPVSSGANLSFRIPVSIE